MLVEYYFYDIKSWFFSLINGQDKHNMKPNNLFLKAKSSFEVYHITPPFLS
jgi:hypothetical protein